MAELADAHGSGPCTRKGVGVRVPSSAPLIFSILEAQAESTRWYFLSQLPVDYLFRAAEADADYALDWRESWLADPQIDCIS